jgi:hypothetical protein
VAQYSQNEMTEHIISLILLDCVKRGTVAGHLFPSRLCSFISGKLKDWTKIYYFSDGAAMQYKNEKFHQPLLS